MVKKLGRIILSKDGLLEMGKKEPKLLESNYLLMEEPLGKKLRSPIQRRSLLQKSLVGLFGNMR
jgi:hypothetical protein